MSLYILEHKTSGSDIGDGSKYWERLKTDLQASMYLFAADKLGYPGTQGIIYDVVKKPDKRNQKSTTPEDYGKGCAAAIEADPSGHLRRVEITRSSSELGRIERDFLGTVKQIAHAIADDNFPRNPNHCEQYNRLCDFFHHCWNGASLTDRAMFVPRDDVASVAARTRTELSASSLASWQCPRLFQIRHREHMKPAMVADALTFGTLWHLALEKWFHTGDLDAANYIIEQEISYISPYERAKMLAMMHAYHYRWKDEPLQVLLVEESFDIPVTDGEVALTDFAYTGRLDAVVRKLERKAA